MAFQGSRGTSCERVEIGCTVDADCPSKQACIRGQCQNPCLLDNPCGLNALCEVLDTLPVRTMVCICKEGYEGDASIECTPVKTCPPGKGLILNEREECVCPPGNGSMLPAEILTMFVKRIPKLAACFKNTLAKNAI